MSESNEGAPGVSRADNVTDLPDKGKASTSRRGSKSGGGFWKLSTFTLLALLLLSGGWNLFQQRLLDGETAHYAGLVAAESRRADAAEQRAAELRERLRDVHEEVMALQNSLGRILASTGALLDEDAAVAGDEASLLDSGMEAAEEAATEAAGDLPDVGAPREAAQAAEQEPESLVSRLRSWFANLFQAAQ